MYTLAQLAYFDRCLFPSDMAVKLLDKGVHENNADAVEQFIVNERRKGNNVGIVRLYQEFISIEELTNAFDAVVYDFLNK